MRILATALLLTILGTTAHANGPDLAERDFVSKIFRKIQTKSFSRNVEMCGYIGLDRFDRLTMSQIMFGDEATCTLPDWPENMRVIASFHTHSTYSPDYFSEIPSSIDMKSDSESGINGWIATPGGRLWFIDGARMVARQVCGVGCMPQDPNFIDDTGGSVKPSYTYSTILKNEGY